ncbi:MAG: response regulator transcription factor [Saprospiraceae bacterium]
MTDPKLLLVEDDSTLGYILKEYLEMKNFAVTWAKNGLEGLAKFREQQVDLCIVDVMMPEMDGFTMAERIRQQGSDVPLLFLTAKSLKVDVLKGFSLGADDYIIKPVEEEELVARINAILRRAEHPSEQQEIFEVGDYAFDSKNQKLSYDGEDKYLTEREAQLLRLLCLNKGNLLSRQYVLKNIWGKSDYFNRRSMDVFISKLRKYLSKDERIQITNVHGSGFILSDS